MTISPLKRFLIPATLLTGSIFCALTAPLALYGHQSIVIKLQREPVFVGELRDIAAPYIGLATAISLGSGIASIGLTGWRHTAKKSVQLENQVSQLKRNLQAKEYQVSQLQLSDEKLVQAGLAAFLHDEMPISSPATAAQQASHLVAAARSEVQPQTAQAQSAQAQSTFEVLQGGSPETASPATRANFTVQTAVSSLPAAQSFMGFTRQSAQTVSSAHSEPAADAVPETLSQFDEMQQHLKQLMAQMELLQGKLLTPPVSHTDVAASQSSYRQVA